GADGRSGLDRLHSDAKRRYRRAVRPRPGRHRGRDRLGRRPSVEGKVSLGPVMIDVEGTELTSREREWLESPACAGAILFSRNFASREQLEALVESIHAVREPPLL